MIKTNAATDVLSFLKVFSCIIRLRSLFRRKGMKGFMSQQKYCLTSL